jgi:hypothetical protein
MPEIGSIGKTLLIFGIVLAAIGGLIMLGGKIPWLGKLPGDLYIQKKGFFFYFPLTTSIILSIILSLVLMILRRR